MFVILNPSLCHSERSEESHGINELKMEILRLKPQDDITTQSPEGRGGFLTFFFNEGSERKKIPSPHRGRGLG